MVLQEEEKLLKTQLVVEGTPEELRSLLDYLEGRSPAAAPPTTEHGDGLPAEVEKVVAGRGSSNRDLYLVRRYLATVAAHTVSLKRHDGNEPAGLFSLQVGTKKGSDDGWNDYIRLHLTGVPPSVGYVWPANGLLNLRLPATALNGQVYAQPRQAKDSKTFGIQIRLTSEEAVEEANGLLDILVRHYYFGATA
jgi:hypothetical protein